MAQSKRKLPPEMVKRVGAILRDICATHYTDANGKVNQTRAAKAMGISQGHLSELLNENSSKAPGIYTLIQMRAQTQRTIDDLLGLGPMPSQAWVDGLVERLDDHTLEALHRKLEMKRNK